MDNALTIKRVPLDAIHQDPANVRLHDERNLEAIKGSLARFGQQKPIVVDRQGVIRAGNGTYVAAKALGWTEIDVVESDLEGVETLLRRLPNQADVVFLSPEGHEWSWPTTNPMRIFDRLLDRAGIAKVDTQGQKLDIHAMRTTCASRMARRGVPLAITQRWLGHSDPKLTAQHYTDLGVEDLRAAVERAPVPTPARKKEAR